MTGLAPLHLRNAALEERANGLCVGGVLTATDLLVVDAVAARFGEADPDVLLGLAFAVRAPRAGHVGVVLTSVRAQVDDERATSWSPFAEETSEIPLDWPTDPTGWEAAVLASPMVGDASDTGRPFVRQDLADGRTLVMTRRMWREQERLAAAVSALTAGTPSLLLSDEAVAAGVVRMFGDASDQGARAVATAARHRLTVVTGGPGTGKTYSIKRLLALLIESVTEWPRPSRRTSRRSTSKTTFAPCSPTCSPGPCTSCWGCVWTGPVGTGRIARSQRTWSWWTRRRWSIWR